jgi:di/tricarboxylate transporter
VTDLANKAGLSPSKLLIPLSYAAILGGTCTLIGTSTNLVLVAMAEKAVFEHSGEPFVFGFFEIGRVGVPVAGLCAFFLLLIAGPLLPSRDPAKGKVTRSRIYKLAAVVGPSSRLIGKSVDESGLANVDGCALTQIAREEAVLHAPAAGERIVAGDRLAFEGQVDGIVALTREPRSGVRELLGLAQPSSLGLGAAAALASTPAEPTGADERMLPSVIQLAPPQPAAQSESEPVRLGLGARARAALASLSPSSLPILVEVVLAPRSRVVGLRARAFGQAFDVSVVAIARDEERTSSMVSDVSERYGVGVLESYMFAHQLKADGAQAARSTAEMALCADDSLLLLTTGAFLERYKRDDAFTAITELDQHVPLRHSRAPVSSLLAVAMIAVSIAAREQVDLLLAALFAVAAMLVTGCLTTDEAREAFRTDLFLVIGSSFGLSTAMQNSGAAALIASVLVRASGDSVSVTVVLLYAITALLTEVITNNAAVALMVSARGTSARTRPCSLPPAAREPRRPPPLASPCALTRPASPRTVPDRLRGAHRRARGLRAPAARVHADARRVCELHHADRLPDQLHGLQAGRLQVHRLPARRDPAAARGDGRVVRRDPLARRLVPVGTRLVRADGRLPPAHAALPERLLRADGLPRKARPKPARRRRAQRRARAERLRPVGRGPAAARAGRGRDNTH